MENLKAEVEGRSVAHEGIVDYSEYLREDDESRL